MCVYYSKKHILKSNLIVEIKYSRIFNQNTAEGKLHLPDNFKWLDLYPRVGALKLNYDNNKAFKYVFNS